MKRIDVPYKQSKISVEIPERHLGGVIEPNEVPAAATAAHQLVLDALRDSVDTPDFDTFMASGRKLLVIVNDGTRPTPTKTVLESMKGLLAAHDVEFIVATGVHRAPTEQEYRFIFGDTYEEFADRVHVHDARVYDQMQYIGTSSAGTELWLHKRVVSAEKILVIGSVEPHYFAGYTGGRKAFLPGTAAYRSIEQNHKLALSAKAKTLALEGNPVHEDMMDAVALIDIPVFSIMTVLDKHQQIHSVFAGSLEGAFHAAITSADSIFVADIPEKVDVVVSVARYPMDVDLYQAQKAIENGKLALKEGGTLLLVASCREGVGEKAFLDLLSSSDTPETVLDTIAKGYRLGYHKAAKLAEIYRWATVGALTELDDRLLESIFIKPVHDLQYALDAAIERYGSECKVLFLTDGTVTVPRIANT